MSRTAKSALDPSLPDPLRELTLTLTAAELEELVDLLCACSTLRLATTARVGRIPGHCRAPRRHQWCRTGWRAAGRHPDTLFG
jgi:hypothetical protein